MGIALLLLSGGLLGALVAPGVVRKVWPPAPVPTEVAGHGPAESPVPTEVAGPAEPPAPVEALDSSASVDSTVIVPGHAVGPFVLGLPVPADVYERMGLPEAHTPPVPGPDGMDTGAYDWPSHGVRVKVNDGRSTEGIFSVYLTSPKYATREGIGVGSTLVEVKAALPHGRREESFHGDFDWQVSGMALSFVGDRVAVVAVFPVQIP